MTTPEKSSYQSFQVFKKVLLMDIERELIKLHLLSLLSINYRDFIKHSDKFVIKYKISLIPKSRQLIVIGSFSQFNFEHWQNFIKIWNESSDTWTWLEHLLWIIESVQFAVKKRVDVNFMIILSSWVFVYLYSIFPVLYGSLSRNYGWFN